MCLYPAYFIGPRQHTDTLPRHFGGRRFGASATHDPSVCLVVVPYRLLSVVCRRPLSTLNTPPGHRLV